MERRDNVADLKLVSQRVNELSDLLNQLVMDKAAVNSEVVVASQVLDDALHEYQRKVNNK